VKNHTGDAYDTGMALRVIAFEPTAELAQEQIIETIKPTIYYNGKIARMGEVIVGTPTDNPTPEPLEHNILAGKEESHG
jgi:hypothetical protein